MANTDDTPPTWVFEENVPNGERIELVDTDTPHGFPRSGAIFERATKVEIANGGIYNPGSSQPVVQIKSARPEPITLKGAFRDHHTGVVGHARTMSDALERMALRRRPLFIRWLDYEWQGVLEEARFPVEGPSDILYELKFFIGVGPSGVATAQNQRQRSAPVDQIAQRLAEDVAKQRAAQLALKIRAATALALTALWDTAESTCNTLTDVAATLDQQPALNVALQATGTTGIYAAAKRVDDAASKAQKALQDLRWNMEHTTDGDAVTSARGSDQVGWRASRSATVLLLDQWIDEARKIRQKARERIQATLRVVRAGASDTLPSIAQKHLGSAARAADLGVASTKLKPGTRVRIPETG